MIASKSSTNPIRGRYDVFHNGQYLCTINQTLRVLESAFDCERCMNAMQTLIDQHPTELLIMPDGEHRKSSAVSLADIAPRIVSKKAKKRPTLATLQGTHFLKKGSRKNNDLHPQKKANSGNLKSREIR